MRLLFKHMPVQHQVAGVTIAMVNFYKGFSLYMRLMYLVHNNFFFNARYDEHFNIET